MTRVMITGAAGMVGHKVVQRLAPRHEVIGTTRGEDQALSALARAAGARVIHGLAADDLGAVRRLVNEVRPAVIVNCVGVIKQRPDVEDAAADWINGVFPHELAKIASDHGARLIHLSTDCVFSGSRGQYAESDVPDPVDSYGRSKLAGELSGPGAITLRTSVVGRELHGFRSLLEWLLSHPRGTVVRGFRNAIFSGLTTIALADEIGGLIEAHESLSGLYHLSSSPISKFELLRLFNSAFDRGLTIIPDDDFRCNRSLVSARYRKATGYQPESWDAMVAGLAKDPTPYGVQRSARASV